VIYSQSLSLSLSSSPYFPWIPQVRGGVCLKDDRWRVATRGEIVVMVGVVTAVGF
jgi:hypothetical protein